MLEWEEVEGAAAAALSGCLTGGPQESLPLCSKYCWPLETQGNSGQSKVGLVMRGESGEGGKTYALSTEAGSVLGLPDLCFVAKAASSFRIWSRSLPPF